MSTQARTRLARRAVIDAARTLFVQRGYAATTISAISAASDVPPASVYRLFSSKRGVLKALLDESIAGDDDSAPLGERPHIKSLLADPNPMNMMATLVRIAGDINARAGAVYGILASAAASDAEAAALLDEITRQRHQGQAKVARALAQRKALRPALRESDAKDIIHALVSPEMYRLLVIDRGWPPAKYEQWLTDTLTGQLLGGPTPT